MAARTRLLVVGGPTASGKTKLAIRLAKRFGTEIISGDSRQFYREMRIGNARPDPEELAAVPHHFIADRSLHEPLSAGRFAAESLRLYHERFSGADYLVLVGGSGLYLRALCEGLDEFPDVTPLARTQVQSLLEKQGMEGLRTELRQLDPDYYATVDRDNPRRLQRALEVCLTAGRPYSSFLGKQHERPFDPVYLMPAVDRPTLYERINHRVDRMVDAGLEAEARALYPDRHLPVLQTVGYQEWWPLFSGPAGSTDRATVIELIKRNSRRYAKRQMTWFRKGDRYRAVSVDGPGLENLLLSR